MQRPIDRRQSGFSLISFLFALAVILVVFLVLGGSLRSLGALAADAGGSVAGMVGGGAQARAMRAMQAVADANSRMKMEHGRYARSLRELKQLGYGSFSVELDPWGNPWRYEGGATSWRLISRGADGAPGPPPPSDWHMGSEDSDLVMVSGTFKNAPTR